MTTDRRGRREELDLFKRWGQASIACNTAHKVARDIMTRQMVACSHARVGVAAEGVEHSIAAGAESGMWILSHVEPGFDADNALS